MTDYRRHIEVWHDVRGECRETVECPQYGMVWTTDGPRLADDPTRPPIARRPLTGSLRRPTDDEESNR